MLKVNRDKRVLLGHGWYGERLTGRLAKHRWDNPTLFSRSNRHPPTSNRHTWGATDMGVLLVDYWLVDSEKPKRKYRGVAEIRRYHKKINRFDRKGCRNE